MKRLVAFFSASGVTAQVAGRLAQGAGADLYEIKPVKKYTSADLNWQDSKSRSSVEMKDRSSRPEIIVGDVDLSGYDTVYLGFPIWWYVAPTIINTFLESYDFSGKKVVLFATSGGSRFGNTLRELKKSVPESCELVEGKILNHATQNELESLVGDF